MVAVNLQVYYDAARNLANIGGDINAATTTLVKALADTRSMAGTSAAATAWATSYDTRASSVIDNARRLGQTLPYFASLIALAGYNHELADYNADINPHKGTPPAKPATVPSPAPLCWAGAPSSGGAGDGLVSMAALMDHIHVHIPDGNTDKLATATTTWNRFLNDPAIDYGASKISDVASGLRQNQAHEVADLDDLVMMLSGSVNKVYAGAKQLATECDQHNQALEKLRAQIHDAITQLEEAIALSLAVSVFADVITAGIGVVLDGAALAADTAAIRTTAEAITGFVNTIDLDRILALFSKEEDLAASVSRDLTEVDSLTPAEIEVEESGASSNAIRTVSTLSATEQEIAVSAREIFQSADFATIRAAYREGKAAEVVINGTPVVYEPSLPSSGFTLFGEKGFVIGPEAFSSESELAKTVAHESYRLATSESAGGLGAGLASSESNTAFGFAEKTWQFIMGGS